jgi:glycerophosphoryl diester phosphodiesterase
VPALVDAAGCAVWSPYFGDLTLEELRRAHELGLGVVVWTVNEPDEMGALIDMGVDGIITDYPDRGRSVMAERSMPLPEPTPVRP